MLRIAWVAQWGLQASATWLDDCAQGWQLAKHEGQRPVVYIWRRDGGVDVVMDSKFRLIQINYIMIIVALHSIPCWSSWCALWEKCQGENRGVTKLHRSLAGAVYRLPQFGKRVYIEVLEPRAGSGVRAWCMVGQGDSLFTMEMNMKHAGMAGRPRDGNEGIHAAHAVYGNGIFLEHIITHGKTLEYIHCNCNSVHWHALK